MTTPLEFGLDTFGDVTIDASGAPLPHAQVIRNVVEEAVLADQLGVDFIGVGEHHRADFAISAPEVVLAAIAARTKRIRLGSAVTVLSSDDPVRVFQRFATLDAVSNGRAEVILGRGSFTESFPLFGFDLRQYEELFEEKLDLFAALLEAAARDLAGQVAPAAREPACVSAGRARHAQDLGRRRRQPGVGGARGALRSAADARHHRRRPEAVRALRRSLPPRPQGVRPAGQGRSACIRRATSPTPTTQAREELWPDYKIMRDRIGKERGWPPMGRDEFEQEADHGSLYVGSPETVARKIAATVKALGVARFELKYSAGPLPHEKLMRSIELYGRKVMPLVRDLLS